MDPVIIVVVVVLIVHIVLCASKHRLTTLSTGTLHIIYDSCVLQICDFGLAKWKQQAATQTTTGRRRGTIAYMAPEVFRDVNTPRTVKYDVYSFGVLLWELLSEKKPFEYGTYRRCLFVCLSSLYFRPC